MKRYGNLFEKIVDIDNIRLAHKNARKNKTKYREVIEVDKDSEYYIQEIYKMLIAGTYVCSKYEMFKKIDKGKEREIFRVPYFPDRVIQHAIMQVLEPIWKKTLIVDTFQAIKGRGVHKCKNKVEKAIQKDKIEYCLQIDVRKFYPSISNKLLKETVRKRVKCKGTLRLLDTVIEGHESVPIGNYISQYFGNLVLSDIDHYCKEVLKLKYYYRYCDDTLILSNDKKYLHKVRVEIERMLIVKGLQMKRNYQVYKITRDRGVDCFGFVVYANHTKLRGSIAKAFKEGCIAGEDKLVIPAYYGWIKHIDASLKLWNKGLSLITDLPRDSVIHKLTLKLKEIQ